MAVNDNLPESAREAPEQAGRFEATRWSMILRAQDHSTMALDRLFTAYRQPLLNYLERRVRSLSHLQGRGRLLGDAEDLLQGFFAALLRRGFLQNISADKGRFRTFILRALDHYLGDEIRRLRAGIGGGDFRHESKDAVDESGEVVIEPRSSGLTPDQEFDRALGTVILGNAFARLREAYQRRGRLSICEALEPILFEDEDSPPYCELGDRLGMEAQALRTTASRMRRELRDLVRDEIRQTVANEEAWEEECQYFMGLFVR